MKKWPWLALLLAICFIMPVYGRWYENRDNLFFYYNLQDKYFGEEFLPDSMENVGGRAYFFEVQLEKDTSELVPEIPYGQVEWVELSPADDLKSVFEPDSTFKSDLVQDTPADEFKPDSIYTIRFGFDPVRRADISVLKRVKMQMRGFVTDLGRVEYIKALVLDTTTFLTVYIYLRVDEDGNLLMVEKI